MYQGYDIRKNRKADCRFSDHIIVCTIQADRGFGTIILVHTLHGSDWYREGRKPGVFMNPRVTHMYCFLAWKERIESTHKTHNVGT
jgi:hypothetical protein